MRNPPKIRYPGRTIFLSPDVETVEPFIEFDPFKYGVSYNTGMENTFAEYRTEQLAYDFANGLSAYFGAKVLRSEHDHVRWEMSDRQPGVNCSKWPRYRVYGGPRGEHPWFDDLFYAQAACRSVVRFTHPQSETACDELYIETHHRDFRKTTDEDIQTPTAYRVYYDGGVFNGRRSITRYARQDIVEILNQALNQPHRFGVPHVEFRRRGKWLRMVNSHQDIP